jgi:ribonuclease HII
VLATAVFEDRLRAAGFARVAGCDEAGRGALAGPLVAAAVVLPEACGIQGLADSKLLTRARREELAAQIRGEATAFSVVWVGPERIDRVGLQRANLELLARALRSLPGGFDYGLADGFPLSELPAPVLGVRKGDQVSACVAAASILAKVTRDAMLVRASRRYPGYGFERHKGYGTDEHWSALRAFGPSAYHRRSFTGVANPWQAWPPPGAVVELEEL